MLFFEYQDLYPAMDFCSKPNKMHLEPSSVTKAYTYRILETIEDGEFIDYLGLCRGTCLLKLHEGKKGKLKGNNEGLTRR